MKISVQKIVQEATDKALDDVKINNIPFCEWVDNVSNACKNKKCNLSTCRYNSSGKCTNGKKRKECIGVSEKVLCIKTSKEK